jgi:hypothetical protein
MFEGDLYMWLRGIDTCVSKRLHCIALHAQNVITILGSVVDVIVGGLI